MGRVSENRARERTAFSRRSWKATYDELRAGRDCADVDAHDLERLAVAAYLIGADDWVARSEEACRALQTAGDHCRAARCAFWLGFGLFSAGQVALGAGWLGRAQALVDAADGMCAERGLLLIAEGIACCDEQPAHACEVFTEAVSIGDRYSDPDVVAIALMGQGQACLVAGATQDAFVALDEAMVVVSADGVTPLAQGVVYCGAIDACQHALELRRAAEWTALLSRWCDDQPDLVPFRGQCLVHRSEVMQLQGNWTDALDEARRARAQLEGTPLAGEAAYREGELLRLMGSVVAAERCYLAAAAAGRDPQPGLALLRLATGDVAPAVNAIRRASAELRPPGTRVRILAAAVEVYLAAGDVADAEAAADVLREVAATLDVPFARATSLHAAGQLDVARGDAPGAFSALRRAWALWRELETPYEAARTRAVLALACRAGGDEETAEMELDAARSAFSNLGAGLDFARLERESSARSAGAPGQLSSREVEVLRLVAAGHTNREIAARLIVSEHTVARHVQNIFTKLDVHTRTAAAAVAHRHGLA
jgi:DNA-binding CsgD family transcriptional regulator